MLNWNKKSVIEEIDGYLAITVSNRNLLFQITNPKFYLNKIKI